MKSNIISRIAAIVAAVEVQHCMTGIGNGRSDRGDGGEPSLVDEDLVRHVEAKHDDRCTGTEDDGCGMWVDIDVELGSGRDVAEIASTTHQHDLADTRHDCRLLDDGQGNMLLNTPENIAAIEFLRDIIANEYVPEILGYETPIAKAIAIPINFTHEKHPHYYPYSPLRNQHLCGT